MTFAAFCLTLNSTPHIIVVPDWEATEQYCPHIGRGCAILQNNTIVVAEDKNYHRFVATVYHELLHLEYKIDEHSREMIRRDNKFRDYMGVCDRYLYEEDVQEFMSRPYDKACTG
jgi:hypothetical protein